jgi:5,5'-dehydrodivanillate O-demethylase
MQLSAGWVEGNSLRCFYHGWKYDASGQCVEQPAEERSFADKVQLRTYPTEEHLGLIFAYLGDGEPPPLPRFPEFEAGPGMFEWSSYVRRCNYFQNIENSFDNSHVGFVHRGHGDAYNGMSDRPIITTTENEWGIAVNVRRVSGVERTTYFGMPNVYYMYALAEEGERGWIRSIMWWVPIDDTSHVNYWVRRLPLVGEAAEEYKQRAESRQKRRFHGDVADDVLAGREHRLDLDLTQTHMVNFQDDVAEVGQGAIADREHERLGRQDEGIIFLRKIWSRELRALEEGSPLTGWERPPGMVPTPRDQAELLTAKGR